MSFAHAITKFRNLQEAFKGDPAYRDFSQSSHLSPKVAPGIRKDKSRTKLSALKVAKLRDKFPRQNSQEIPSPLPGVLNSKDASAKYRGQLHNVAVDRLKTIKR